MKTETIKIDGTREEVLPKNGTDFSLEEMQNIVGGYIQFVYLEDGRIMVINEDGKIIHLPINEVATNIYANPNDCIVGDVLITNRKYVK